MSLLMCTRKHPTIHTNLIPGEHRQWLCHYVDFIFLVHFFHMLELGIYGDDILLMISRSFY